MCVVYVNGKFSAMHKHISAEYMNIFMRTSVYQVDEMRMRAFKWLKIIILFLQIIHKMS